jgi:hypothetical protein
MDGASRSALRGTVETRVRADDGAACRRELEACPDLELAERAPDVRHPAHLINKIQTAKANQPTRPGQACAQRSFRNTGPGERVLEMHHGLVAR